MNYATAPVLKRKSNAEAERFVTFGAPPVNLFKSLRQNLDLSHEQLGRLMLLSKQALIRLEQGTFERPLPTAVDWWVNNHGISELQLVDAYEGFQEAVRARHTRLLGPLVSVTCVGSPHPLRQVRKEYSLSEVSKMLCLPQATLQYFEKKWRIQKSVPKALTRVLRETGYYHSEVATFVSDYAEWRGNNK